MSNQLQPDVVRGFLSAVIQCLRTTVGVDAVVAAVGEPNGHSCPQIVVALDIGGDFQGPITWVFPPEIALELVSRLLDDPHPAPETAMDGATELANILTGRASAVLEQHGFRCELGAPRLHEGALPPGVNVRMSTAAGPIDLVIALSAA
jgi:CheY-specific phosphatase CheX